MSVLIRFAPGSLTAEQYDAAVQRLTEDGVLPADGLDYEICFGSGDKHRVSQASTPGTTRCSALASCRSWPN